MEFKYIQDLYLKYSNEEGLETLCKRNTSILYVFIEDSRLIACLGMKFNFC